MMEGTNFVFSVLQDHICGRVVSQFVVWRKIVVVCCVVVVG